jgi:hypothetical protein
MFNLAAIRYRKIFTDRGGPIDRVESFDLSGQDQRMFQANAYLRADLQPTRAARAVYGNASGSGTHSSPMVARYMAISESLERWAYASTVASPDRAKYGFDVDPMSNGMAAFPGLFAVQARRTAYLEAVERFSLIAWWEGMLPAIPKPTEWSDIAAAVIWAEPGAVVVIVHKRTAEGQYAYGHAAAGDFATACRKAAVELGRHEYVIRSYRLARACTGGGAPAPTNLLERRSVHFASEEGHEEFLRRLHTPPAQIAAPRRIAFDGEIPGPWTRYAHVWRFVFHPVTLDFLNNNERYFLW